MYLYQINHASSCRKWWKMYVYMLLKKQKLTLFSIKKVKYTKSKLKIYKVNPLFCKLNFYLTK